MTKKYVRHVFSKIFLSKWHFRKHLEETPRKGSNGKHWKALGSARKHLKAFEKTRKHLEALERNRKH